MRRAAGAAHLLAVALAPSLLSACAGTTALRASLRPTDAAEDLEQVTRAPGEQASPAVSPDGAMLAFEDDPHGRHPAVVVDAMPALSERARVVDAIEPAWLAGGGEVVFVSNGGAHRRVMRRSLRTGELSTAGDPEHDALWPAPAPAPAPATSPSPSPNGLLAESLVNVDVFQSLAPRSRWSFDAALTLTTLDGYGAGMLLGSGIEPSMSPDGSRVAFVRRVDGKGQIFVASKAGIAPLTHAAVEHAEPSWSPDGREIAFCAGAVGLSGELTAPANLYLVGADGHGLRQLTFGDAFACKPSFAPDGRLFFEADVGDGLHLWSLRPLPPPAHAGPARLVTTGPSVVSRPLPAPTPQNSLEAQRARLPPKADCDDPVTGAWRSQTYAARWGEWYDFTLEIHRAKPGSRELVGTITSHYWEGDAGITKPTACTDDDHLDAVVRMPAEGRIDDGRVLFGSSSYEVENRVCGHPHGYNPDNFSGEIDPSRQEFQSVNNDGDRAVNEPHVFRRVRCESRGG